MRAAAAVRALAGSLGGAIVRARVDALEPVAGGVRVRTSAGDLRCARCLVCAGAGTDRLVAPLGIAIARDRRAALRLTFRTTAPRGRPDAGVERPQPALPRRARVRDAGGPRSLRGRPDRDDEPIDAPGAEALPAGAVDVRAARRRLIAYVRAAFPGLHPEPVDAVLRLIAPLRGPDEDRLGLWERDGVLAFAGHNLFKHAPRLGELLADAALSDGPPDPRLRPPA